MRASNRLASGTYGDTPGDGSMSSDTEGIEFADFDAKRGDSFTLRVNVDSDAHVLDVAHPVLWVSANSVNLETALVLKGISPYAGFAIGIIGVILIAVGMRSYKT